MSDSELLRSIDCMRIGPFLWLLCLELFVFLLSSELLACTMGLRIRHSCWLKSLSPLFTGGQKLQSLGLVSSAAH